VKELLYFIDRAFQYTLIFCVIYVSFKIHELDRVQKQIVTFNQIVAENLVQMLGIFQPNNKMKLEKIASENGQRIDLEKWKKRK